MHLIQDFAAMVSRLFKPADLLLFEWRQATNKVDMVHAIVGIGGEIGEIQELFEDGVSVSVGKLTEEVGDMLFYIRGVRNISGIEHDPDFDVSRFKQDERQSLLMMAVAAGNVIDTCKKWAIYNQPLNKDKLCAELDMLEGWLCVLLIQHDITFKDTIAANMLKLEGKDGRYASGTYSDHQAKERRDKKPFDDA